VVLFPANAHKSGSSFYPWSHKIGNYVLKPVGRNFAFSSKVAYWIKKMVISGLQLTMGNHSWKKTGLIRKRPNNFSLTTERTVMGSGSIRNWRRSASSADRSMSCMKGIDKEWLFARTAGLHFTVIHVPYAGKPLTAATQ
jgi:hypothetical protein